MSAPRALDGVPARNFAPDAVLPLFRSVTTFLGRAGQRAGFAANVPRGGHLAFPLPFRALKSAVKIQKPGGHRPAPQTHAAGPHAAQRAHHSSPPLPAAQAAAAEVAASLSIALVDSIVSGRVGAPHESNRTTSAQRILHLRAVFTRAPVATSSRTRLPIGALRGRLSGQGCAGVVACTSARSHARPPPSPPPPPPPPPLAGRRPVPLACPAITSPTRVVTNDTTMPIYIVCNAHVTYG